MSTSTHRRLAAVKRLAERGGLSRIPGYRRGVERLRRALFPSLHAPGRVALRTAGITLEVPREFTPHHLHHSYEPVTTRAFRAALTDGGTAVDVGAHIGYYTCLAAKDVGPRGVVHAVEPAAENAAIVRRNATLNGFSNVIVHPVAAAAQRERRALMLADSSDSHSLHLHPLSRARGTTTVETAPIDDLIDGPADVIKVDVEGGEAEAMRGMRRLLARSAGATVLVEWNPRCLESAGTAPEELPELLQAAGITDLQVLDDSAGKVSPLAEVLPKVQAGQLPDGWYVTLMGRVVGR